MPESLKNILLVMADGGYLVPPAENPHHVHLWEETWKRLDKFLPGMFAELFPGDQETQGAMTRMAMAAPSEVLEVPKV